MKAGTLKLAGTNEDQIVKIVSNLLQNKAEYTKMKAAANPYRDGEASKWILEAILYYFGKRQKRPQDFMEQ